MQSSNESIIQIPQQEMFLVECVNAFGDRFNTLADLYKLLKNKTGKWHHHPLTGPISIENTKAGDYLRVDIGKINAYEMAQTLSQSAGIDPRETPLIGDRAPILGKTVTNEKGNIVGIHYNEGMILPYKPMVGMIGTTPKDCIVKTGHGFRTGGNLDLPFITENTSIFLPIEIDGAGLYLGDCHALQGYGELSGIALECSADVEISCKSYNSRINWTKRPIIIVGKEPLTEKKGIGFVGVSNEHNNLNESLISAYNYSAEFLNTICSRINIRTAKSLVGLLGHAMLGQAGSKTAETVSMVFFPEESLKEIYNANSNRILEDIIDTIFT